MAHSHPRHASPSGSPPKRAPPAARGPRHRPASQGTSIHADLEDTPERAVQAQTLVQVGAGAREVALALEPHAAVAEAPRQSPRGRRAPGTGSDFRPATAAPRPDRRGRREHAKPIQCSCPQRPIGSVAGAAARSPPGGVTAATIQRWPSRKCPRERQNQARAAVRRKPVSPLVLGAAPGQRRPQVGVLLLEPIPPHPHLGFRRRCFRQGREIRGVVPLERRRLATALPGAPARTRGPSPASQSVLRRPPPRAAAAGWCR